MQTVQKTTVAKKETIEPEWLHVDAEGQIVGRLATRIATVLMGKHKPIYTPHVLCGDFVVVTNCDQIRFSGKKIAHEGNPNFTKKMSQKEYARYTGYPGGRRTNTGADLLENQPTKILEEAVRRMLPKNKLGRKMLKMLKLYAGPNHPHQAQQPQDFPA